jgi:hypothetical protein
MTDTRLAEKDYEILTLVLPASVRMEVAEWCQTHRQPKKDYKGETRAMFLAELFLDMWGKYPERRKSKRNYDEEFVEDKTRKG